MVPNGKAEGLNYNNAQTIEHVCILFKIDSYMNMFLFDMKMNTGLTRNYLPFSLLLQFDNVKKTN